MKQMDEADTISKQRLHWKHGNNINKPLPAAAGAGNELHQSSIFVTLILEHTFKWRSLGVSEACNWLTASAGPRGRH